MITIKADIALLSKNLIRKLSLIKNPEYLLRPVALEVIPLMTKRIHSDGVASDGSQIGTYSPGYMKVRTGNFGNSKVFKKGDRKGEKKDSGTYSRGVLKGQPRPRYNRSNDTKIIVSLTRQLENDWAVKALTSGGYGIGFNNHLNLQKARWVEAIKFKTIFNLSASEKEYASKRIQQLTKDALNS